MVDNENYNYSGKMSQLRKTKRKASSRARSNYRIIPVHENGPAKCCDPTDRSKPHKQERLCRGGRYECRENDQSSVDDVFGFVRSLRLTKTLGKGGFGHVFSAVDPSGKQYAVKLEEMVLKNGKTTRKNTYPQLYYEYRMYRHLYKRMTPLEQRCLPAVYEFVQVRPNAHLATDHGLCSELNALVMQNLGSSVQQIFKSWHYQFTVTHIVAIGLQMLDCLQALHRCGVIHRDLKPDNFCVGLSEKKEEDRLYVVDFGLSKCYVDSAGKHIPPRDDKRLTGTPRYVSINCHEGCEQSRRDDLESMMYVLIYLLRGGNLPWSPRKPNKAKSRQPRQTKKQKRMEILRKKKETLQPRGLKALLQLSPFARKGLSKQQVLTVQKKFKNGLQYIRGLRFTQDPNYSDIRRWILEADPSFVSGSGASAD